MVNYSNYTNYKNEGKKPSEIMTKQEEIAIKWLGQ